MEPLKALGYTTIDKLKEIEKPGKLHQEMMGYRKKITKLSAIILSVVMLMATLSCASTKPLEHDQGIHEGWYKNPIGAFLSPGCPSQIM